MPHLEESGVWPLIPARFLATCAALGRLFNFLSLFFSCLNLEQLNLRLGHIMWPKVWPVCLSSMSELVAHCPDLTWLAQAMYIFGGRARIRTQDPLAPRAFIFSPHRAAWNGILRKARSRPGQERGCWAPPGGQASGDLVGAGPRWYFQPWLPGGIFREKRGFGTWFIVHAVK